MKHFIQARFLIIITVLCIGIFSIAHKTNAYGEIKGISLGEFSSCDYYLIEDSLGDYTLAEWYGGITPYRGNIVVGELHSYGFKDLYNISMDNSTHVWLDDWMLSQDRASEKIIDKCGWNKQILTYFSDSDSSYYTPPSPLPYTPPVNQYTCPTNSHTSVNDVSKCDCDTGYEVNSTKNACIPSPISTFPQGCISNTGFSSTTGMSCDGIKKCSSGMQLNSNNTECITIPIVASPKKIESKKSTSTLSNKKEIDIPNPSKIETSTEIATPVTTQPIKKLKWYQKIFNWFKGK